MKDADVNSSGGSKMATTDTTTSLYVQRISKIEYEVVKLKDDLMMVKGDQMTLKTWIIAHCIVSMLLFIMVSLLTYMYYYELIQKCISDAEMHLRNSDAVCLVICSIGNGKDRY
ncbi:uncharacterized protein G2W53_022136 [Senna tora]|uniref:Uncharacterized protein n=1 Tax=Senna tora TaxID=362788 RepID=A0A834TKV1_9FABA|nr:uncharacterized protein G2W53_022136 [Senna tora]